MDISKFYENIILRDILAYIFPGAVSLSAIVLFIEAAARKYAGQSLLKQLNGMSAFGWLLLFIASFMMGHIVDAINRPLRRKERKLEVEFWKQKDGEWLSSKSVF